MPRLRVLLLWVVMLALPLQGYAAATMAFCAVGLPAAATVGVDQAAQAHPGAHDHAAHTHGGAKEHAQADGIAKTPLDDHGTSDTAHKCGTCGACHATALPSTPLPSAFNALPQARLAEPFEAVASLAPRALDKPPRA